MGAGLETLHESSGGLHYNTSTKDLSLEDLVQRKFDNQTGESVSLGQILRIPSEQKEIEENRIKVEDRGVHCQALMFLLRRAAPRGDWRNRKMSIRDLVALVRKDTIQWKCCGTELLKCMYHPTHSEEALPMVAKPTVFLSYSWDNPAYRILNDICWQYGGGDKQTFYKRDNAYVWIDIMAINQQTPVELNSIQDVITSIGETWLYLDPLAVSVTRIWVLFEMYCTVHENNKLRVIFGEENWETSQMRALTILMGALDHLDVRKSEATVEEDRTRILKLVEKEPGFDNMNRRLIGCFKDCAREDLLNGFGRDNQALDEEQIDILLKTIESLGGWEILYYKKTISIDPQNCPIGSLFYWFFFKLMSYPSHKNIWEPSVELLISVCNKSKQGESFPLIKDELLDGLYTLKTELVVQNTSRRCCTVS